MAHISQAARVSCSYSVRNETKEEKAQAEHASNLESILSHIDELGAHQQVEQAPVVGIFRIPGRLASSS